MKHGRVGRRLIRPTVSVIVPFYNVEDYLAECLDSILGQGFTDFEIVLVDDGSPDRSRAIAQEYVAKDHRVRLLTRPNGGLGAARNTGVRAARGKFLTFVDSDDMLASHALGSLVGTARSTGSDIVVGSVRRFDAERSWRPAWVESVQTRRRTSIGLAEFPALLRNLYTWNKLFRKDFWDAQDLWFREGVHYEDQPIITQLYNRARSIDVIPEVVYKYRAREDRSSISQQTASLKDLRSRLTAFELTRDALVREAPEEIYHAWLQTLFDSHFHWYLMSPGTADDVYWDEIRRTVVELLEGAPQELWDRTPPLRRVVLALTRLGRRADVQRLAEIETARTEGSDDWPATATADGVLVQLPLFGDPELDDSLFLLRPDQLKVSHQIEHLEWVSEGDRLSCVLAGWAYLRKIDLSGTESHVELVVRGVRSGAEHVFASNGRPSPSFQQPLEDASCDYAPGTFTARVEVSDLVESDANETWDVFVRVSAAGFTVTQPVTRLIRMGQAGGIQAGRLATGDRVAVEWRHFEPMQLRVIPFEVEVADVSLEGRRLSGRLAGPRAAEVERVVASAGPVRVAGRVKAGFFELRLPEAARLPATWGVSARFLDDRPTGLVSDTEVVTPTMLLQPDRLGELSVTEWSVGAVADSVSLDGERLVVVGRVFGSRVEEVCLTSRNKKARAYGEQVPAAAGEFTAELPLTSANYRFGQLPLPIGEHDLGVLVRVRGSDDPVEVPLQLGPRVSAVLPVKVLTDHLEGRVVRGPEGGVRLVLLRPIGEAAPRYAQNQLKLAPPQSGLTHGILFRSYFGEKATDNGTSIQAELKRRGSDLPCYWAVHDHSVVVPEGGIPVVVNSRQWFELVSSVKYYVDNMYQPEYLRKQPGQVLVETFHGYPFKQMGHPHWRNLGFSQAKIDSYDARAREWDYLVSPARYATPLLTRDFAYDGEVLEIGYPRNDVLSSPEADSLRATVRRSLGIAEHQTAVLYAPTFRDYLSVDDMRADMVDFFDFGQAHAALGDDFVLLVRGHAFNARKSSRVAVPGVVEVTDYPEVSDLYLASDAAIVDYSSLRFDYGVTGKPMIFHVPDLQRYKDTRGWLFDFEPTAPGPLLDSTAEVVAALQDLAGVRVKHQAEYDAFRADFLDLDDGRAGERFVDAVIVPRGDA